MKLTLVGHASWLVETDDIRILFDPLLHDPNQRACYEIHPSRGLRVEAFSDIDVIVVSHRHIDHFDVRSLCSLPKSATVVCPRDTLVTDALGSIGFGQIRAVTDWEELRFGGTAVLATPSTNPVPEHGFVVSDGDRTAWNQVDTQLAADTAATINQRFDRLDVVIAPWQPLLELKFQQYDSIAFPHTEYAALISRAAACRTRLLVPGACGFRYTARAHWLNRIAFPVARQRFIEDLGNALPAADTVIAAMDPGDEIACDAAGPSTRTQASEFIKSARDEENVVAFCPVDPFQNLFREARPVGLADGELAAIVDDLDDFVRRAIVKLATYTKWRVVYQLIVCVEQGNVFINWDFGRAARRADERTSRATATCIIAEQALRGLAAGTVSWEEACHSGHWRFFQTVAQVSGGAYATPDPGEIVDLLQLRYPYGPAFERLISSEIYAYSGLVPSIEKGPDGRL